MTKTIDKLPRSAGVYKIYREGKLIYVGQSKNIKQRFETRLIHRLGNITIQVEKTPNEIERKQREKELIQSKKPRLNYVYNPECLSRKEMAIVSYLECKKKRFFTKKDIEKFFKNKNEMNVYIHRLKEKRRIVRINKNKYCLIPSKVPGNEWTEHPFIIVDEMFNGENYCIGGKAAAQYWGLIDQIPQRIDVFSKTRQGKKELLHTIIYKRRVRKLPETTKQEIGNHPFLIATKKESEKWA